MQTSLGTKSVCILVTKRSNGFDFTNLDYCRSHKIEKKKKTGFGPFLYKFFVPIRVGLRADLNDPNSAPKFHNFENFANRKEAFFQTISKTPEATEGPEI